MYIEKHDPTKPLRIKIKRRTIDELNQAIKDLEDRGFKVLQRGSFVTEYSEHHSNREFAGTTKLNRVWAIVEK